MDERTRRKNDGDPGFEVWWSCSREVASQRFSMCGWSMREMEGGWVGGGGREGGRREAGREIYEGRGGESLILSHNQVAKHGTRWQRGHWLAGIRLKKTLSAATCSHPAMPPVRLTTAAKVDVRTSFFPFGM
jgi:hypothetical protein